MSREPSTDAIENSAAHTNPYIRGHCDEICDHLLMLAEAYKPPTTKPGDLESEFPGYARAAQEASEIFEAWSDQLDDICDTLAEFEEGEQVLPLPRRFVDDDEPTTPGGMARAHAHYLITTLEYPMRFGMTAEETKIVDVNLCKRRVMEAQFFFEDMQQEAVGLSEKYLMLLREAGYDGDVFGGDVKSSLPDIARLPRVEQVQEDDTMSGGVDER